MIYADARAKIKTGDMLVWSARYTGWTRKAIESLLVKLGTQSQWTHVGVAWVEHGRVWVMDLTTKGCAPRLLSGDLPFYWLPSPRPLSDEALQYAFGRFGLMTYSRWQAVLAALRRLAIGTDMAGECAEFALEVWAQDEMAPTTVATPAACVDGALEVWGAELIKVTI